MAILFIGAPLWLGTRSAAGGDGPGPVAPELSSFSPLDKTELVDHFTGDFRYNVPLMEVPGPNGGYPIALTYASGITPDQDASWVGLGWTLSPGAIVRQMRGVADDSDGDEITTVQEIEPARTYGLGLEGNYEIFGVDTSVGTGLRAGLTGYFDNYRGFGITHTVGLSAQSKGQGTNTSIGISLSEDTLEGARIGASASLSLSNGMSFGADAAFDASRGLSALGFSVQSRYQSTPFVVPNVLGFLGYAKPAALPGTGREMDGSNIKVSFKMGGEVYGNFISGMMFGFFNEEHLRRRTTPTKAYGFLHIEKGLGPQGEEAALDLNREKDGPIYDQSPNLALPVLTHDLFVVTGRDLVGTFRAYRNDVPVVFDPREKSSLTGGAVGIDVGYGNVVKVGVSGALNHSATTITRWDGGGLGTTLLDTVKNSFTADPSGYRERTYFKFIGEPTFSSAPVGGGAAVVAASLAPVMDKDPPFVGFQADAGMLTFTPPAERTPRANLVQAFTNGDLAQMFNGLPDLQRDFLALSSDRYRRDHPSHIGAFRITDANGLRHVYGIAVYNLEYEEHKFSVDRTLCPTGTPCIGLPPGGTGTIYDHQVAGSEKLLEIKSLGPYPASYLLTAILGPDYIDADDVPGPSDGDFGYWVRFNYARDKETTGVTRLFQWRIPFVGAAFVRGPDNGRYVANTERLGDKGYVTYGKRESWYLASIETGTHMAFMCVDRSSRPDAIGATDRRQIAAPASTDPFARPWKLTSVRLVSKNSLAGRTIDPLTSCPSGLPLVEAHLEYDYSLAKGAPNQVRLRRRIPLGKLTLQKVHFTHLGSERGRLSPYTFDYGEGDPGRNPRYQPGERDRWGSYQPLSSPPATTYPTPLSATPPAPTPPLDDERSWTNQGAAALDDWSSAWTLRRIVEPSGRVITVEYEADDYAYVQNKPATRMFPLVSVDAGGRGGADARRICPVMLLPGLAPSCPPLTPARPRVYFRLETPVRCSDPPTSDLPSCSDASAAVKARYLASEDQVFFKIRVALKTDSCAGTPVKWQTIAGYARATNAGLVPPATGAQSDVGWIELEPVHSNHPPPGLDYHPFAHAAWQYLRLQQPELSRDGGINGDPSGDALKEAFSVLTLVEAIPDIIKLLTGVYPGWAACDWGRTVDLAHSWIRLRDPDGIKKGGGARVRRLEVDDNWNRSTAGTESGATIGYTYTYRLEDGRSSGVAAYEPMIGGEENALRKAKPFQDEVLLSSNYNLFAELPNGESHYPGPAVGYARVLKRTLAAEADITARSADCGPAGALLPNVNSRPRPTSIGPTVSEFYTARDFPVLSGETRVDKRRPPLPLIVHIPLLGTVTVSTMTASQGYSTVINDMHGRPRRETVFEYTNGFDCRLRDYVVRREPIRETTYRYRAAGGFGDGSSRLDDRPVRTLTGDPDPTQSPPVTPASVTRLEAIGEQSDFVVDLRRNRTESFDGGINVNVDTFLAAWIPIPIPVPMPNFGYSLTETKTVVTSRVVHRAGILEEVSVREGSSQVTTRNDFYDPLTGRALLTESENAYGHPVFSYEIPARWTFPAMGGAYDSVGRRYDLSSGTPNAAGTLLSVPATANVDVCPTNRFRPQRPGCLPVGSELVATSATGGGRLTLLEVNDSTGIKTFSLDGGAAAPLTDVVVVRSGNRNLLTTTSDRIRALADPLERLSQRCSVPRLGRDVRLSIVRDALDAANTGYSADWPGIAQQLPAAAAARNDFARGTKGIFRRQSEWVYLSDRKQSNPLDLSHDGTFELAMRAQFNFTSAEQPAAQPCLSKWIPKVTHTRYSPAGYNLENHNPLEIHSAALYGARGQLAFAVASNARFGEIGYEGFETTATTQSGGMTIFGETNIAYAEQGPCTAVTTSGTCVARETLAAVSSSLAHTGKRSLQITKDVTFDQPWLKLAKGTRYLVSAWVSLGPSASPEADVASYAKGLTSPNPLGIRVHHRPPGAPRQALATLEPAGPIVDGWQRIEGTFSTPPVAAETVEIALELLAGNAPGEGRPVYVDDIRLHPEDASLESYVYDLETLRMTATLDENNFATFFRYTPDGMVGLIQRETVRGIFAERESRVHVQEQP